MNPELPWEIGGDFHWPGLPTGPFISWPHPHIWFSLGRHALLALWRQHLARTGNKTLLLPDYFCPEVTDYLKQAGVIIKRYADDPRRPHPDWNTLTPSKNDLVLAVNYFGVRHKKEWQAWRQKHETICLIENHTHDPLSRWALTSNADYAFASLRKTFPATDGAILWSPGKHPLPAEPQNQHWSGSALKLAGMIWKKEYLAGQGTAAKSIMRKLQLDGEKFLAQSQNSTISPWSMALLATGVPQIWHQRRRKNVRLLLDLITEHTHIEPLFTHWPSGHCPFNAILVFPTEAIREKFRLHFIMKNIYTPVHWVIPAGVSGRASELSRRILTIPVDHRYQAKDVYRIFAVINNLSI